MKGLRILTPSSKLMSSSLLTLGALSARNTGCKIKMSRSFYDREYLVTLTWISVTRISLATSLTSARSPVHMLSSSLMPSARPTMCITCTRPARPWEKKEISSEIKNPRPCFRNVIVMIKKSAQSLFSS